MLHFKLSPFQVYHAEISSAKVRGLFCSFTQLFISFGLVFIYLLSTINTLHYYDSALILGGVVVAFEVLIYFISESPRWLVANDRKPLAVRTLKFLRGPHYPVQNEVDAIDLDIQKHPRSSLLHVFHEMITKRSVLVPVLIVLTIMCLQQMSGLNASSAYASVIFKDAGVTNPSETATYAVGGVAIFFTFVAIFLVDFLGRKILLVVSGIGMLIGTLMLGTHFYLTRPAACLNQTSPLTNEVEVCNSHIAPLAIVSLMVFNGAFSIGWGPVPWVLLGELLPMRVRGIGSAMANFVNWGSAALVTGCYFKYSELVNTWFAWWTFSVFNFCGILFVSIFLKETKKKVLEDI